MDPDSKQTMNNKEEEHDKRVKHQDHIKMIRITKLRNRFENKQKQYKTIPITFQKKNDKTKCRIKY